MGPTGSRIPVCAPGWWWIHRHILLIYYLHFDVYAYFITQERSKQRRQDANAMGQRGVRGQGKSRAWTADLSSQPGRCPPKSCWGSVPNLPSFTSRPVLQRRPTLGLTSDLHLKLLGLSSCLKAHVAGDTLLSPGPTWAGWGCVVQELAGRSVCHSTFPRTRTHPPYSVPPLSPPFLLPT